MTTTSRGATAGGARTTTGGGTATGAHGAAGAGAGRTGTATGTHGGAAGAGAGKGLAGGGATRGGATGAGRTGGATGAGRTGGATAGRTAGATGGRGWSGGTAPKGARVTTTRSGATVARRSDGRVAAIHDSRRGIEVRHGVGGGRTVIRERADHSRVVVYRGGRGYVQHPYAYRGHNYAYRSYYYNGHYYNRYYGNYYYHGVYVNPYYPAYYYPPAYYGWVYNPWVRPYPYAWGWAGNPWYGYYGAYFTPYPVYPSAAFWLTDYIIANSLQAAYDAQAAAMSNPAPLTPDVKALIADEVKRQIALENAESQGAAKNQDPDMASSSIQRLLSDGTAHVFVAGVDLDVVDSNGNECGLSEGDALQLNGQTAQDATAANLVVLASKGGRECSKGALVSVGFQDLQDMQNHMRETIGQGMQELQAKQGQGGLPAAPAAAKAAPTKTQLAADAPPPDQNVQAELQQENQEADQAEKESNEAAPADIPPPAAQPAEISVGQTEDQVKSALGNPNDIVNLGSKKIYVYKDMKITFKDGKVTDVQ